MKRWVKMKEDQYYTDNLKRTFLWVPKGAIGFQRVGGGESGYIQFPQTVAPFKDELLENIQAVSSEEAEAVIARFGTEKKVAFPMVFEANAPASVKEAKTKLALIKGYNAVISSQIKDFVDKRRCDGVLQTDFSWAGAYSFKLSVSQVEPVLVETNLQISAKGNPNKRDFAMDLLLIEEKIKKFETGVSQWLSESEPWELLKNKEIWA